PPPAAAAPPPPAPMPPEPPAAEDDRGEWVVSTGGETPAPPKPPEPEPKQEQAAEDENRGILGRTVGAILGVRAGPEEGAAEQEPAERREAEPEPMAKSERAPMPEAGDRTNINLATFEQLREVGFSVTQATRVITYRERQSGFKSLDDLAKVPGMPPEFLHEAKPKLTI
ncbi:MAG: helix-hairpin-helix domain-containing protein, partial [Solirubrobacterales bacterium]